MISTKNVSNPFFFLAFFINILTGKIVTQQTTEMQQIRQTVLELEISHRKMKERYEEEISRLKRELETRGPPQQIPAQGQIGSSQQPIPNNDPQQQPPLGRSNNAFNGIISGSNNLSIPQQQQQQPKQQSQGPIPAQGSGPSYPGYPANGYPNPINNGPPPGSSAPLPGNANTTSGSNPNSTLSPESKKRADPGPNELPTSTAQNNATAATTSSATAPSTPATAPANPTSNSSNTASQMTVSNNAPPSDEQLQKQAEALGNIFSDLDKIRPEFKKKRDDWFVVYNELAPRILDVDLVHSLDHSSVVCCVRFSSDGRYVATGCNRTAQIFDVRDGTPIAKLEDKHAERDGDLYIRSVCFSPDGEYLATGAEDKLIRVWNIKSKTITRIFQGHEQDIYSLDFSHTGRYIASGSGDRTVRMWDMQNGQCVLTLTIADGVTTVAISPDGRYVAAGSLDKTVRVWDTSTGFLVERLEAPDGHKDSVYSVAFTPDGKDLVSGSLDKTIKLWQLQAPRSAQSTNKCGVCLKTFVGHKDFVLSVASTPDGKWILSGSKDRGVQFWDPQTAQVQLMLQGHKNSVISVAPSPTETLFATGSGDCKARIWKYENV